jgi:hypothetical protein
MCPKTPPATAKPGDDPSEFREDGLLVNLAIAQNTIKRWD